MKLISRTILITGGSSGIGYETAKQLAALGNNVIITGRDQAKLEQAERELGVATIALDITRPSDIEALVAQIRLHYSDLSILINNAGSGQLYRLGEGAGAADIAKAEFESNYFGPVRLTEALLSVLKQQPEAAIVNVSSNAAIHPLIVLPSYSDSKAALHSHTVSLRLTLSKETNIRVFEVVPSLINTEGTRALGMNDGLPPSLAARQIVAGIINDQSEIYVGESGEQRLAFLADPEAATLRFNSALL